MRDGERDVLAGEAVRVAAAVVALVRGADDEPDAREQAAHALEHPLPLDGVGLHDRPLLVVERARLVDDLVRDRDLADVVQQRAELGGAAGVLVDPEPVGDGHGELDDVLGVLAGVGVVGLDDVAQQQSRPAVGARELDRLLDARRALEREDREETGERQHEERRVGLVGGGEGGEQADRREEQVDAVSHLHLGEDRRGRDSPRQVQHAATANGGVEARPGPRARAT